MKTLHNLPFAIFRGTLAIHFAAFNHDFMVFYPRYWKEYGLTHYENVKGF